MILSVRSSTNSYSLSTEWHEALSVWTWLSLILLSLLVLSLLRIGLILILVLSVLLRWLVWLCNWLSVCNTTIQVIRLLLNYLILVLIPGLSRSPSIHVIHCTKVRYIGTSYAHHIKLVAFQLSVCIEGHYQCYDGKHKPKYVHCHCETC